MGHLKKNRNGVFFHPSILLGLIESVRIPVVSSWEGPHEVPPPKEIFHMPLEMFMPTKILTF